MCALTLWCELDTAVGAEKQLAPQRSLQVLDGPRHIGLTAQQVASRLGKALIFGHVVKNPVAVIAIPSILQQSFISVGNIVIQGVINGFGTGVMAGYSAAVKLNNLVITSFTTLGNGISNYTAQNLGAQKLPRIKEGFRAGLKLVWLLSVPLVLLYFFGGWFALGLFLDEPTAEALQTGIAFLRILSPFYFVVSAKLVADGVLRGSGMMDKFMIATFTDLIIRVALAVSLARTPLGTAGIWCAWPVGWSVAAVCSFAFYRRGAWSRAACQTQEVGSDVPPDREPLKISKVGG